MPATLWLDSSGRLIVDADGKPILCAECPCCCEQLPDEISCSLTVLERATFPDDPPTGPYRTWGSTTIPTLTLSRSSTDSCVWNGTASITYSVKKPDGSECYVDGPFPNAVTLTLSGKTLTLSWGYGVAVWQLETCNLGTKSADVVDDGTNSYHWEGHPPRCDWVDGNGWRQDYWSVELA